MHQLLIAMHQWLLIHRDDLGELGPGLTVNDDVLATGYDSEIFPFLNCFPRTANACKRAAILMFGLAKRRPIQFRSQENKQQLNNAEHRLLRLINAKAAFEIAEAYARQTEHGGRKTNVWKFKNQPKFPSIHSYVDFMSGLASICELSFDADCDVTVEFMITRLSIILELCFYRTNDGIAGKTDAAFWKVILTEPGFCEYGYLNLDRNADDVIGLPADYRRELSR